MGAWSNDAYTAIVQDAAGSSYVTGEFGGVVDAQGTLLFSEGSLDVLVAKYNSAGQIQWVQSFGGSGLDNGIALALGPSGELVVTGQFMGDVEFGNTLLTSQGGTQDVFVLSLQAADGAFNWVRQCGGADGVDRPNAISVAANGAIAITGEFVGTADFGGTTLTSINDPQTGLPSVDIFVAAYSPSGDALWVKHGAASYADRGMAVAHDQAGKVYVTGQFSDTLTFDQTHANAMFSAVFIARFAADGAEEWFRIFGGASYNQVFAMRTVEDDRLLLVGDLQGSAIFLDSVPDFVTSLALRSSFLLAIGLDGEFLQAQVWGSDHVVNTRALSVYENEVAVLGRFQCQFTDFSDMHGEGTWLATGQHDLYVARFQLSDLALKDAQQFGGQENKVPGGISHSPDGAPVFCGSFAHLLVFPSIPSAFNTTPAANTVYNAPAPQGFCSDAAYGSYVGLRGAALMDAFIARGWAEGRSPYDVFARPAGLCDRPQRDMFISMNGQGVVGADSLAACDQAVLSAVTHTAFTADTSLRHTAPKLLFAWNTGSDSTHIQITQTGWYHLTVTSAAGCWQRSDSLYVTIDASPLVPLVSDDVVVNTAEAIPEDLSECEPFAPWLWASGVDPANNIVWYGPAGTVQGDSIHAEHSGLYTVIVSTPQGCSSSNALMVASIPSGELPPLEVVHEVLFPQDDDLNDTIHICANEGLRYTAEVQLFLNGQVATLPYGVRMLRNCNGGPWGEMDPEVSLQASCSEFIFQEGWHTFEIGIMLTNAPCGEDTLLFFDEASVYVLPWQVTFPTASLSGPAFICPGDTASIELSCTHCDEVDWSGPGIFQETMDSILVISQGTYRALVTNLDTNGCVTTAIASYYLPWNPRPLLLVDPSDGIICPGSDAIISSDTEGSDYQWFGPLGPLNVDNDSIATSQQGLYYLSMVDSLGCPVTSDPVLVTDYATPYLNVVPDNTLCTPGETATLQVVTTGQSSLQWWTPLSGNALQMLVDEPGVYTCSVEACDITTVLSVEIFGNNAIAELVDPGPFTPCPGEELLLEAVPGNALTYWLPGPVIGTQLSVSASGNYTLVAVDANGCEASTEVTVTYSEWQEALVTSDTLICFGTPLILEVPGSGLITWFADPGLQVPLGSGPVLDLGVPSQSDTIYVQQAEGPCTSAVQVVEIMVLTPPALPLILAEDSACAGSSLQLSVQAEQGVQYTWSTPSGPFQGPVLTLDPLTGLDEGSYSVVASNAACSSEGEDHILTVLDPEPLDIGPDSMICPGGEITFLLPDGFQEALWNGSTAGNEFTASTAGEVFLQALGSNGCIARDTAMVSVFAFSIGLSAQPVEICFGADAIVQAQGSGSIMWYADESLQQPLGSGTEFILVQPQDSSILYVQQSEWQCLSQVIAVQVNVSPVPMDVSIQGPTELCVGSPLELVLVGMPGVDAAWSTPTGPYSGPQLTIPETTLADEGLYVVVPTIGPCIGDTLSIHLDILVPDLLFLGNDTIFCDGSEYIIALPTGFTAPQWTTGSTANAISVTEAGSYGVSAMDGQGCATYAEISLETERCDLLIPNIISPNGDGVNDQLLLDPGSYHKASMTFFNRYGDVVWEGDPSRVAFRGLHYLNSEELSAGVYYYALILYRSDGGHVEQKGYLHIVR